MPKSISELVKRSNFIQTVTKPLRTISRKQLIAFSIVQSEFHTINRLFHTSSRGKNQYNINKRINNQAERRPL